MNEYNLQNKISDFQLDKTIASDYLGKIKIATHKPTNLEVMVHVIEKPLMADYLKIYRLDQNIITMGLVKHDLIVQLYDVVQSSQLMYIVYEKIEGVNLTDYVLKKGVLSESEIKLIMSQVLNIAVYLSNMSLFLREITPDRIFIDQGKIKLMPPNNSTNPDLSISNVFTTKYLDQYYSSPEVLSGQGYSADKAEVWSIGILMYFLLFGVRPFDYDISDHIIKAAKDKKLTFPKKISEDLTSLLLSILEPDPNIRISLGNIIKEKWFVDCSEATKILQAEFGLYPKLTYAPVSDEIIEELYLKYNLSKTQIKISVVLNKFNKYTLTYYLHIHKERKWNLSENLDLKSFMSNKQNFLSFYPNSGQYFNTVHRLTDVITEKYDAEEREMTFISEKVSAELIRSSTHEPSILALAKTSSYQSIKGKRDTVLTELLHINEQGETNLQAKLKIFGARKTESAKPDKKITLKERQTKQGAFLNQPTKKSLVPTSSKGSIVSSMPKKSIKLNILQEHQIQPQAQTTKSTKQFVQSTTQFSIATLNKTRTTLKMNRLSSVEFIHLAESINKTDNPMTICHTENEIIPASKIRKSVKSINTATPIKSEIANKKILNSAPSCKALNPKFNLKSLKSKGLLISSENKAHETSQANEKKKEAKPTIKLIKASNTPILAQISKTRIRPQTSKASFKSKIEEVTKASKPMSKINTANNSRKILKPSLSDFSKPDKKKVLSLNLNGKKVTELEIVAEEKGNNIVRKPVLPKGITTKHLKTSSATMNRSQSIKNMTLTRQNSDSSFMTSLSLKKIKKPRSYLKDVSITPCDLSCSFYISQQTAKELTIEFLREFNERMNCKYTISEHDNAINFRSELVVDMEIRFMNNGLDDITWLSFNRRYDLAHEFMVVSQEILKKINQHINAKATKL